MRRQIATAKATLERRMKSVVSEDQVDNMSKKSRSAYNWSDETYKKAFKPRFTCGTTEYEKVRDQGHPLPTRRSVRWKVKVVSMEPGILE